MKIDPSSVAVNIVTKDGLFSPDIAFWLDHMGVPVGNVEIKALCNRDNAVAHNATLYRCMARAKSAGLEWCLLIDGDVEPIIGKSDALFDAQFSLTCVKCETQYGEASWVLPSAFHCQMWIARLADLEKIARPAFHWITDADGGKITGCFCAFFAMQAHEAKLTTGHVGWCNHVPRQDVSE